ncbi:helix-turn-helix domain-containing protein [Sphingomonas sp. VDB2]|uniref:helix-turn-helix domain-containing protein n=1 Tax=Sphingomonas sp. VDB2 TaxID=3228751 RepID=UPI003A8054E9|nr:DUF4115 domain-containing protein [Sphingobium sp.]
MADEPELETGAESAPEAQPSTPGAKLRAAREAQGLSIQDVATRTRIAQRQLEAVERDDYAALPGIPYAVGFARAYARAVDLDEVAIAAEVRHGVHNSDMGARYEAFEPVDPARVPPRRLAWVVLAIVIVLIAGYTIWRTQLMTPPTGEEIAQEQAQPAAERTPGVAPVAPAAQPVVFTAVDDVWLRIYDEAGERLKDGLLKKGESFTLPPAAKGPMILTGRPQALSVTVGGKPIAPLGAADRTIADVPVSAEALLARGAAPAAGPAVAPARPAPRRTGAGQGGTGRSEASSPAVPTPAPVAPVGDGTAAPQP